MGTLSFYIVIFVFWLVMVEIGSDGEPSETGLKKDVDSIEWAGYF